MLARPRRGSRRWTPIASGPRAARAWRRIRALAAQVRRLDPEDPSLAGGSAGIALFLSYLAVCTGRTPSRQAMAHLRRALLGAGAEQDPRFFDGLPGVGWVAAHLGVEPELLSGLDSAVSGLLTADAPYELGAGLVGLGVYALERLPRPAAQGLVAEVLRLLELRLVRRRGQALLQTPAEHLPPWQARLAPAGLVDLGMAHGLAGALAFSASALSAGVSAPRARRLVEALRAGLLGEARRAAGAGVPSMRVARGEPPMKPRLAWCYGDAGVACALLAAGDRGAARGLLDRVHPLTRSVRSASLCHGAAGVMHLYSRLGLAIPALRDRAVEWMDAVLEDRYPLEERGAQAGHGLLSGEAGVGLALLAAVSDVEPAWDRALLLSVVRPPPAGRINQG